MLIAVVIGAPILHNVIPHTHGFSGPTPDGVYSDSDFHQEGQPHQEKESPIWDSLHSAIFHEGKEFALALVANSTFLIFAVIVLAANATLLQRLALNRNLLTPFDPQRGRLLRRGIVAYRKFG